MEKLTYEMALHILNIMDPIAVFDTEGRYLFVNRAWKEGSYSKNLPEDQLHSLFPWQLIPDSKVKEVLERREPIMDQIITVAGKTVDVCYWPLWNDAGEFEGVLMQHFFDAKKSRQILQNAVTMIRGLRHELKDVKEHLVQMQAQAALSEIVGESSAIMALKQDIANAARTNSTVLIDGETGTGKELVARAIHRLGKKTTGRFVPVNCATIPENLMESEFFGYEDGAFTGAKRGGRAGKFELAQNGTLFLDEIQQLTKSMQPKFLRVLQEREIERISSSKSIPVNFRCIAATNVDLKRRVSEGTFREDLFYRLNVVHIHVPPLRERKEDIPLLVDSMISTLNVRMETDIIMADPSALEKLMEYQWPGNVRELQNVLESAMNRAWSGILCADDIQLPDVSGYTIAVEHAARPFRDVKRQMESAAILRALEETGHNKAKAARMLGISRSVLYKKMRLYDLS